MIGNRRTALGRKLPLGNDQSACFLPWIVALFVYAAGLGGVGLLALDETLHASDQALSASATLQVPGDTSKARLATVLALLRQTPGIQSVHLLEPAEIARLLEPWLGPAVPLDQLPVPQLIDLHIDPNGGTDLAALRRQLASVAPTARIEDHVLETPGMHAAVRRIEGVLAASIAAALLLIAVSAGFAVRTSLLADRSAAWLLHVLGATDAAIAREFAIRSLRQGLAGGVIGGIAALASVLALKGAGSILQLPTSGDLHGIADWRVWAVFGGAAAAAGLVAMASAWVAVRRRLALMP